MVKQPARSSNNQLRMTAQLVLLSFDILPAIERKRPQGKRFRKGTRHLRDLHRQFTRRRHNQDLRFIYMRLHFLHQRQQKSQRLARACRRLNNNVYAAPHNGNRFFLHWSRHINPKTAEFSQDRLGNIHFRKTLHQLDKTSVPVSVIRIVFSHWADNL